MDSIITTDLESITLKSKFLNMKTSKGEILLDIKQMMQSPINSDDAYFNATRVASFYPKHKELNRFLTLKSTKEYIKILEDEFSLITPKKGKSKIETHYTKRGKETEKNKGTFGTYLHNELFFKYISWLDASFEREMHKMIKEIIIHSNELKIERQNTKFNFKPLSDVIKEIYIPNQESDNSKKYAYSTLSNLINIKVLGCSASKYRKDNNIDYEVEIRDVLDKDMLEKIDSAEIDLHGYIKYGKIYDYNKLKDEVMG